MASRALRLLLLLSCITLLTACSGLGTRVTKVLLPVDFVFRMEPAPPPAVVTFKSGYSGEIPEVYPRIVSDDDVPRTRPPVVTRDGWIEVTPLHNTPVQVRVYLRNTDLDAGEFIEIKSVTGDIPYQIPSEIRFLEGVTPSSRPSRIVLKNLKNPYNDYDLNDGALLLVEVIDPRVPRVWRYLFSYKDFGSRQKLSFNVVVNVPLAFLTDFGVEKVPEGVGNAAFTVSYSFGYRFRTQNRVLHWMGDKVALVGLIGTAATLDFDRRVLSSLSVGAGLEFYDFLSLNLLMDTSAIGNFDSGKWGVVVGFDAVRAADFTRKLTLKLFKSNQLR